MKRIYIGGKLNDDAVGYIKNLHRMILNAEKVRKAGFAVFIPGLDFLVGLVLGNLDYKDYFENSQPWLDVADAVFVCPGSKQSKGTQKEIGRAKGKHIPVFYSADKLWRYFNETKGQRQSRKV